MRTIVPALLAALMLPPVLAAEIGAPVGLNCSLPAPPGDAGEVTNRGLVARVFPRVKEIGAGYSGCQAVFVPDGANWHTMMLVEVVNGDPVRIWSQFQPDPVIHECRYRQGKLVDGDAQRCPVPKLLLMQSMPSGCVQAIRDAAKVSGSTRPPQCIYE